MGVVDDGVGPEMSRTCIECGEDPRFGIWERPLSLVVWARRRVRCDNLYTAVFAQAVSDVCARILVACAWPSVVSSAGLLARGSLTSWLHGLLGVVNCW